MKFLLMFFIVMVIAFQWRQSRKPKVDKATRSRAAPASATAMVPCAHCGLHVPEADAVRGTQAYYCSAAHRQALEP
jgi:uncharacterized protein